MCVATGPTVYGIETVLNLLCVQKCNLVVATGPTVYGIETLPHQPISLPNIGVATGPTVYGIETRILQLGNIF